MNAAYGIGVHVLICIIYVARNSNIEKFVKEVFRLYIVESFRKVYESQVGIFVLVLSYLACIVKCISVVDACSFWAESILFIGCKVVGFKVGGKSENQEGRVEFAYD